MTTSLENLFQFPSHASLTCSTLSSKVQIPTERSSENGNCGEIGGTSTDCLLVSERQGKRENSKEDADVGVCCEKQHVSDDEGRKDKVRGLTQHHSPTGQAQNCFVMDHLLCSSPLGIPCFLRSGGIWFLLKLCACTVMCSRNAHSGIVHPDRTLGKRQRTKKLFEW